MLTKTPLKNFDGKLWNIKSREWLEDNNIEQNITEEKTISYDIPPDAELLLNSEIVKHQDGQYLKMNENYKYEEKNFIKMSDFVLQAMKLGIMGNLTKCLVELN